MLLAESVQFKMTWLGAYAGVPRPCNAKRAKESSKIGSPAKMRMPPIARALGKSAGSKCHCVKYHGRYSASVPGAITRKIADPTMAGGAPHHISVVDANLAGPFDVAANRADGRVPALVTAPAASQPARAQAFRPHPRVGDAAS